MTYAFVSDIPASWALYEQIAAELGGSVPDGLVIHAAGPTEEGIRIIDIWESEAAFRAFQQARLAPIIGRHVDHQRDAQPAFRDLHADHVVEGAAGPGGRTHPAPSVLGAKRESASVDPEGETA